MCLTYEWTTVETLVRGCGQWDRPGNYFHRSETLWDETWRTTDVIPLLLKGLQLLIKSTDNSVEGSTVLVVRDSFPKTPPYSRWPCVVLVRFVCAARIKKRFQSALFISKGSVAVSVCLSLRLFLAPLSFTLPLSHPLDDNQRLLLGSCSRWLVHSIKTLHTFILVVIIIQVLLQFFP